MVTIKSKHLSNTLSQLFYLKCYIMVTKVANNHFVGLNYKANMLVLILTGFSSNPHTCVLLEVTFLAIKLMFVAIKRLLFDLCYSATLSPREAERLRLFGFLLLLSLLSRIFVSAERGQKCKDPRNHLSACFHTRRSLFGDTVCGDSGPGVS